MQIDWDTIKRIAKASPDLRMADFVAVWSEKFAEEKRESDRERKKPKPETAGIGAEAVRNDAENAGTPKTYEQQEADLYRLARQVCGKNGGGFATTLLKHHNHQLEPVVALFRRAQQTDDAKAFVAAACRKVKNGNGTGSSLMDAFDRLDDRAAGGTFGDSPEIRDVTPGSDQGG